MNRLLFFSAPNQKKTLNRPVSLNPGGHPKPASRGHLKTGHFRAVS
jgi:hypothetical protein